MCNAFVICMHGCISGLVQSRPGVCIRRVLRQVRSAGLSQTPVLPERPAGKGGERLHDRPHTTTLQLCLLRFSRAWQQVQLTSNPFNPLISDLFTRFIIHFLSFPFILHSPEVLHVYQKSLHTFSQFSLFICLYTHCPHMGRNKGKDKGYKQSLWLQTGSFSSVCCRNCHPLFRGHIGNNPDFHFEPI